ncbi:hypothetical protein MBLNU459_g2054t1 [Dothideomycetes sp. NU459]
MTDFATLSVGDDSKSAAQPEAEVRQTLTVQQLLGHLEESLGRDVARAPPGSNPDSEDDEDAQEPEDEESLEPTPLALFDQCYEDDADDELMDLGIQLGKMRLSDRVGGLFRPKMAAELNSTLGDTHQVKERRHQEIYRQNQLSSGHDESWRPTRAEAFLSPGPDYIAPVSTFFFPEAMNPAAMNYMPSRSLSDRLVAQYLAAVHPIARVVHQHSFERQYSIFWTTLNSGNSPPAPIQAIIFAAMFSGAVSLPEDVTQQIAGVPRGVLVDRLRAATETALSKSNLLRTTKIDTDPSLYGLSAIDTHVRRLIWHQLCYLDIRTCEATGPRPQIRKEDYDTKLPLNVNDEDLLSPFPPTEDLPRWTEMTLTKMKFDCYDMIRQLWIDMPRIDQKKTKLTAVLGKIQKFRAASEAKYSPLVVDNSPLQLLTKHMYRILSNRCFVIVLQRYAISAAHPMPDRLRQILVQACICAVEGGIAMETQPEVRLWSWYRGAVLQYHAAMLLMFQVYARPDMKEATRIWNCLDYIFELRPNCSPKDKAEGVIMELRDRLEIYHSVRKTRATTEIEDQTGSEKQSPSQRSSDTPNFGRVFENAQQATARMQTYQPASPSDGSGSQAGGPTLHEVSTDTAMQAVADIDWNEYDRYFPPAALDSNLGALNFDLGAFTAYTNPYLNQGDLSTASR